MWIPRLITVFWRLTSLVIVLVIQGNSEEAAVQQRLARRILTTLSDLGPCFI